MLVKFKKVFKILIKVLDKLRSECTACHLLPCYCDERHIRSFILHHFHNILLCYKTVSEFLYVWLIFIHLMILGTTCSAQYYIVKKPVVPSSIHRL